jgi:hypothetical protein
MRLFQSLYLHEDRHVGCIPNVPQALETLRGMESAFCSLYIKARLLLQEAESNNHTPRELETILV